MAPPREARASLRTPRASLGVPSGPMRKVPRRRTSCIAALRMPRASLRTPRASLGVPSGPMRKVPRRRTSCIAALRMPRASLRTPRASLGVPSGPMRKVPRRPTSCIAALRMPRALFEHRGRLSECRAVRCERFHVVEPLASPLSDTESVSSSTESVGLSECRAVRCERFHVVEPLASPLFECRERLFECRERLSECRAVRCERFHVVEPLASPLFECRERLFEHRGLSPSAESVSSSTESVSSSAEGVSSNTESVSSNAESISSNAESVSSSTESVSWNTESRSRHVESVSWNAERHATRRRTGGSQSDAPSAVTVRVRNQYGAPGRSPSSGGPRRGARRFLPKYWDAGTPGRGGRRPGVRPRNSGLPMHVDSWAHAISGSDAGSSTSFESGGRGRPSVLASQYSPVEAITTSRPAALLVRLALPGAPRIRLAPVAGAAVADVALHMLTADEARRRPSDARPFSLVRARFVEPAAGALPAALAERADDHRCRLPVALRVRQAKRSPGKRGRARAWARARPPAGGSRSRHPLPRAGWAPQFPAGRPGRRPGSFRPCATT